MNNSLVLSVRLMTYNHQDFILECLRGIDNQKTFFKFEVVIGDDFSSDNNAEYIQKFISLSTNDKIEYRFLSRVKGDEYYKERQLKGRLFNFIDIVNNCKGKYVALLDGDDYWTDPYKLQKQVDFLEANQEYVATFHNVTVETDLKNINFYSDFSWNGIDLKRDVYTMKDVIANPLMPTCSILFRNTLQLPFPEWTPNCMSGDMVLAMLITKNFKIKFFNESWGVYRKHSGGITSTHNGDKINANRIYMYLRMLEHYHYNFKEDFKKVIKKHLQSLSSLSSLSKEDQKIIFKLMPIAYLKVKLKSK